MRLRRSAACVGMWFGLAACYHGLGARDNSGGSESDDASASGEDASASADGTADSGDDDGSDPLISECRLPTLDVYERLAPACAGCHDAGTNVPLAADFVSFERLVAYNEDFVVAGRPQDSALLPMLRGEAPPPLGQMPPGAVSFAELDDLGQTEISMDDLELWIEELEPCSAPDGGLSPRFARRVSAEQIQRSLYQQLDLTLADVEHVTRFPIDDPTFGDFTEAFNSSGQAWARWQALGGPNLINGDARSSNMGPLFFQTLGPMAQAWCRRSIALETGALFEHTSVDSNSAQDAQAIRDNIEFLYLKMLGVSASETDVDAMYDGVYLPYESAQDSEVAWTAVCAAFIRHPLWVSL